MSLDLSIIRYEELPPSGPLRRQKISFMLGRRTKFVPGILKLVQSVVKLMLTTPGTDQFFPEAGTVIPALLKRGVSGSSAQLVKMDIGASIQDLERQIQEFQAAEAIPDDERLREIQTRRVEFNADAGEWQIELAVVSEAGQGVTFDVAQLMKGE